MEKDKEINEQASAKVQLAFAAKVIGLVGTLVWGYSVIVNRLNTIEMDISRMHHEMQLNSEFRIKWPKIQHLEGRVLKLDEHVDDLRFKKNNGP